MLNNIAAIVGVGSTVLATDYDSIATVTVGAGGSSTITFSSIASTYTHLQIRAINLSSSTDSNIQMTFNSDTANNYSTHYIYGDGTTVGASATANRAFVVPNTMANTTNPLVFITDILEYKNTNINKTIRSIGGTDRNGSGYANFYSGNWRSTAAISTITLTASAGQFNQYSSFALYGIK